MKHIKDPIHGYIDVPEEELTLVNEAEFQRLRRIKQLGFSSTVYPSATHTRFAHSLGVMLVADELADSADVTERDARANRVAGLLHDIGHLPYSHTLEGLLERRQGKEHEHYSCKFIDELAERDGVTFPADPKNVKDIIRHEYDGINLVSNEIDADRIDYLLRDSFNTGIDLGQIEEATLMKFADQINGQIGFDHKSLKSVEQLLDARMKMNYSVYSHNTVNITETMLERATEFHVLDTKHDMDVFVGLGDDEYNTILTNSSSDRARELFYRVRDRRLYKTCFLFTMYDVDMDVVRELSDTLSDVTNIEEDIADIAGVPRRKVLFSPPSYSDIPDFETPIRTPTDDIVPLETFSTKPESLRRSLARNQSIHVFCTPDVRDEVGEAAESYLNSIDPVADVI